ncbi:hypothetical protein NBRC116594_13260 [Shimia sp. NS0008-38b]|uniref:hypothetical protein n=1 Tax=Shimia sp. NS0008-38b TaxID=3127653 RepID=UPI003102818C
MQKIYDNFVPSQPITARGPLLPKIRLGYSHSPEWRNSAESGTIHTEAAQNDVSTVRKPFAGRIDAFGVDEYVSQTLLA